MYICRLDWLSKSPSLETQKTDRNSVNEQSKISTNYQQNNFKIQQEVGEDLSICMLNILPKVISLPSWLAINLVKVEI